MDRIIQPASIHKAINAPSSKSAMQRACAAALLTNGVSTIRNYGSSNDDKAALSLIKQMGARVNTVGNNTLQIDSNGKVNIAPNTLLDCGESGLSLRMFTPIAALSTNRVTITGHGSLRKRPVAFFDSVLRQLNVQFGSENDTLPIKVQGPLEASSLTVDGSVTSQLLTGILMAIGSKNIKDDLKIYVHNLQSSPYIDLTLSIMEQFKMNVPLNENYKIFHFKTNEAKLIKQKIDYTVEGDWSNAAFWLVAGATSGSVTVNALDAFSTQADKKILEALQDCGCILSIESDKVTARKAPLKAFHFNASHCPDLFPPLVALAAHCAGTSVIEGVQRLTYKESNRALTLQEEFKKMGVSVELQDNNMLIYGTHQKIESATINSHNDHRIAMAAAIAGLNADGPIVIQDAEAVNKSYPEFFNDFDYLTQQ